MALRVKSIDEETTELADAYDELVKPKKLFRNHNNKLYLALRAYAAGKVGLTDAALALHNRFDPLFCDEADLYSTAKLVGTEYKYGTESIVRITVYNKSSNETKIFRAGVYNYQSASGVFFVYNAPKDEEYSPGGYKVIMAVSRERGSYPVENNASIKLFRADNAAIDKAFVFSCENNAGQLGYGDETPLDFRTRILNDANRQDHIKELELKIRNLPGIFECNLVINEDTILHDYDGLTLGPKEMLITISGTPSDDIARIVCESVLYDTHKVDPDLVVWYYNDLYINGRRPVYYRFHDTANFSLSITYQYDADKATVSQIENAVKELFRPYTQMVTHKSLFSEKDAYAVLSALNLPNVEILNVNVIDANGREAAYVRVPRTRLPHLTGIIFEAVETGSVE